MRHRNAFVPVVVVLACSACGGAAAPMESPAKAAAPPSFATEVEPRTVDEASAQLDRARAMLAPPGGGPAQAPTAAGTKEPTDVSLDECASLCRAFSSLQRAQVALCRLAGEGDPRCTEARRIVEDNAKRVARCGCH